MLIYLYKCALQRLCFVLIVLDIAAKSCGELCPYSSRISNLCRIAHTIPQAERDLVRHCSNRLRATVVSFMVNMLDTYHNAQSDKLNMEDLVEKV